VIDIVAGLTEDLRLDGRNSGDVVNERNSCHDLYNAYIIPLL
jgi:hypothetical protein